MLKKKLYCTLFFCVFLGFSQQSSEQKALEKKRLELSKEIQKINRLLSETKNNAESIITSIQEFNQKIKINEELIIVTKRQISILNRKITSNKQRIVKNKTELSKLKSDYAKMIRNSYKSRSQQSRLMFLFSADNFLQAFKRLEYIKQYAYYRRQQGLEIQKKTKRIIELNKQLGKQLEKQKSLKRDNQKVEQQLILDKRKLEIQKQEIQKQESKYKKIIGKKQKQTEKLDREIDLLIRKAIKSSKSKNKNIFKLTPEAQKTAKRFSRNKGKLIWPVARGVITQRYGEYSDPIYPIIKYFNNGITISSPKNETARAIFDGEVTGIMKIPGGQKAVQLRHGNYITTYYNLDKIFVKKGDKVEAKQMLGDIYNNPITDKTEVKFYLYKNTSKLNPEHWIYKSSN